MARFPRSRPQDSLIAAVCTWVGRPIRHLEFGGILRIGHDAVEKSVMPKQRPDNRRSRRRPAEPQPLLTLDQVEAFFQNNPHSYGLFIDVDEAAEISGNTPGTLRKHVSEGRYDRSVIKGRPLRFVRDLFCLDVANSRPRKSSGKTIRPLKSDCQASDVVDQSTNSRKAGA